jgi:hypothetical protein
MEIPPTLVEIVVPPPPQQSGKEVMGVVELGQSSQQWHESCGDEGDDDENISVVWEDSELSLGERDLVCCEEDDTPLDVMPLASSIPLLEAGGGRHQLVPDIEPSLSDWALGKHTAFGEYVGASYAGYELEVLALLKFIDSQRPKQGREEGFQKQA